MNEQQELYDRLWEEFRNSYAAGTFTSWLVLQMSIVGIHLERLREELRQARRSQGVPREQYMALERDRDRLTQLLREERQNRAAPVTIRPPRPVVEPYPGAPAPYSPPGTADPNPWTTPRTAEPYYTTGTDTRRGSDEVREQDLLAELIRRTGILSEPAQDNDSGES